MFSVGGSGKGTQEDLAISGSERRVIFSSSRRRRRNIPQEPEESLETKVEKAFRENIRLYQSFVIGSRGEHQASALLGPEEAASQSKDVILRQLEERKEIFSRYYETATKFHENKRISITNTCRNAFYHIGKIYEAFGNKEEAKRCFQTASSYPYFQDFIESRNDYLKTTVQKNTSLNSPTQEQKNIEIIYDHLEILTSDGFEQFILKEFLDKNAAELKREYKNLYRNLLSQQIDEEDLSLLGQFRLAANLSQKNDPFFNVYVTLLRVQEIYQKLGNIEEAENIGDLLKTAPEMLRETFETLKNQGPEYRTPTQFIPEDIQY